MIHFIQSNYFLKTIVIIACVMNVLCSCDTDEEKSQVIIDYENSYNNTGNKVIDNEEAIRKYLQVTNFSYNNGICRIDVNSTLGKELVGHSVKFALESGTYTKTTRDVFSERNEPVSYTINIVNSVSAVTDNGENAVLYGLYKRQYDAYVAEESQGKTLDKETLAVKNKLKKLITKLEDDAVANFAGSLYVQIDNKEYRILRFWANKITENNYNVYK